MCSTFSAVKSFLSRRQLNDIVFGLDAEKQKKKKKKKHTCHSHVIPMYKHRLARKGFKLSNKFLTLVVEIRQDLYFIPKYVYELAPEIDQWQILSPGSSSSSFIIINITKRIHFAILNVS